jgi:hypothetical protein
MLATPSKLGFVYRKMNSGLAWWRRSGQPGTKRLAAGQLNSTRGFKTKTTTKEPDKD